MGNNGNGPDEVVAGATPEALAAAKSQVADLTSQLGSRDARMGELQALLTERDGQVQHLERERESLREAGHAADAEITMLSERLGESITKYRDMLVIANPMIPPEMFSGDSIADIDASIERAKGLVIKIRASLDEQARNTAIPAGSPVRAAFDVSSLSAREKIQYAIRKESK